MSVLLLVLGLLTVAPLRHRRLRLSRLDLGKTFLVLLEFGLALRNSRGLCCSPMTPGRWPSVLMDIRNPRADALGWYEAAPLALGFEMIRVCFPDA